MGSNIILNKRDLTNSELTESLLAYQCLVLEHIIDGWKAHLITFKFVDIPDLGEASRIRIMSDEIQAFYRKLVPQVVRYPRSHPCPILIAAPDMPVSKSEKKDSVDSHINDGLHFHGVLLLPPKHRLKETLQAHLQRKWAIYQGPQTSFMAIDLQEIHETPWRAIDYALKSISRRRFDYETIILLPRAVSEL